jgi:hypothetical protein
MSRRSLRPQLNQIRGWVRQGRTDAWIAHQLDVTVQQIQAFKREQELEPDSGDGGAAFNDEVDLRAEDDAAIAAELEEEARKRAEEEAAAAEEAARKAAEEGARSTTARRATACGSIPPCRTIRSTPSIGPATAPSRSRSRRTRS